MAVEMIYCLFWFGGGKVLSENLKSMREEKGYSKFELSRRSDVSHRTIEFIEYGQITSPRLGTLEKLANALGISINMLIK